MNAQDCSELLSWWREGFISEAEVVAWIDGEIDSVESGCEIPTWALELSLRGPVQYSMTRQPGWPEPSDLTFLEKFWIMVERSDWRREESVHAFAEWISSAAMGEDLGLEQVQAGYEIEDALHVREDTRDALDSARDTLRRFHREPDAQPVARLLRDKQAC